MRLNNKGFAISTIMYLILVLVVILMVSTLFILSSRNLILDRQKAEVLNNIYKLCNPVTEETLTRKSDGSPLGQVPTGQYLPGDEYICNVDGVNKYHFYILSTDGNNVKLIMASNYDSTTQAWCISGSLSTCNADGLTSKINEIKKKWTNIPESQIELPAANQIALATGNSSWTGLSSYSLETAPWLYDYLYNSSGENPHSIAQVKGYWTSSIYDSSIAWYVSGDGKLSNDNSVSDSTDYGVRPVVTFTKADLEVLEIYGDVDDDGNITEDDVTLLTTYLSDSSVLINERNADVFFDGIIDENDKKALSLYLSGSISTIPIYTESQISQS